MFQEKELYFFENSTKTVESQKAIVVPKITTGDNLNDDQYQIIEEIANIFFSDKNIYPKDIVKTLSGSVKGDKNYFFSNKEICSELGKSTVLRYFKSPKKIAYTLRIYIEKTDLLLKKIFASLPDCKKLEEEIINDLSYSYTNEKLDFIGLSSFFIESLNAVHYLSSELLKHFCKLNADLENIKNIFIYKEKRDIIDILYWLLDLILRYDKYVKPIKYIEDYNDLSNSNSNSKLDYFFIDSDDISEFLKKVKARKDNYKKGFLVDLELE